MRTLLSMWPAWVIIFALVWFLVRGLGRTK